MASALTLPEDRRSQLDDLVGRMQANNEPDENIQWVVDDFKNKYGAPGPATPPSPIKYIGPHDRPQDQPPLGFRPNEGYTPMSKLGQNILPILTLGMEAAPELGSAAGTATRATGGAIKGGIAAIPTAKATIPAVTGATIGEYIGGPKGAAIGAGIGAAPEVISGAIRGAKAAVNPPLEITPYPPGKGTGTKYGGPTQPNLQPGTIIPRKGWAGPPPEIPPVEEPAPQAPTSFKPNPNIARRMKFGGSTSPNFSAPSGPIKTGKVTGGAAPPIEPIGSKAPVTVPSETLPSRDWRFEDARDMARLLNQHGIDPTDMGDEEWNIAAPALKRNLGVPNARAKNMVTQEWNKLQGAR